MQPAKSRKTEIVFEDDPDSGFGIIAWLAGYMFVAYVIILIVCVLEHG
jgi:hypothetical protein